MIIIALCVPLLSCIFQLSGFFIIIEASEDQPFINYLVVAGGDILSCVVFAILANKIGRKKVVIYGLLIACVVCFVYNFLSQNELTTYICMLSSRFMTTGAFATLSLLAVESVPTDVRGCVVGFTMGVGHVSVLLIPTFYSYRINFVATLAILGMLGFFISMGLKETLQRDIQDKSK